MWQDYSEELISASRAARERNDCVVMAWACVFDTSYKKAHTYIQHFTRRIKGRGVTKSALDNAILALPHNNINGFRFSKYKVGPYSLQNKISISKFIKTHPQGRYFVCVRWHALAVKDGVVYDWNDSLRRQVNFAVRIYLEGEL